MLRHQVEALVGLTAEDLAKHRKSGADQGWIIDIKRQPSAAAVNNVSTNPQLPSGAEPPIPQVGLETPREPQAARICAASANLALR